MARTLVSRPRVLPVLAVLLLGLACRLPVPGLWRPTPTPSPTPTPLPTATPTPRPTATPTPTPTATPTPLPLFAEAEYQHPKGWLSLPRPLDWTVDDVRDYGVIMRSPEGQSILWVDVHPTGRPITDRALQNFALAMEQLYLTAEDYEQTDALFDHEWDDIRATLTYEGTHGSLHMVFLYDDNTVLGLRLFVADAERDRWGGLLDALLEQGIVFEPARAADLPLYPLRWAYRAPGDLFMMNVPAPWYFVSDSDALSTFDSFVAPAEDAGIDVIAVFSPDAVSNTLAGDVTLGLLRDFYASDLRVTDDQVMPDGSERLVWYSESQGILGVTFFEVRDTNTYLFLTMYTQAEYVDLYTPLFDDLLNTYVVP